MLQSVAFAHLQEFPIATKLFHSTIPSCAWFAVPVFSFQMQFASPAYPTVQSALILRFAKCAQKASIQPINSVTLALPIVAFAILHSIVLCAQ